MRSIKLVLYSMTALLLLFSFSAQADFFGGPKADNKVHFVCWVPWASTRRPAPPELNSHLTYLNLQVYPATGVHAVSYPCEPLVDVFYDDSLNDAVNYGLYTCKRFQIPTLTTCIEADVLINPTLIEIAADILNISASDMKEANWCHETGHSFGLNHYPTGCLKQEAHTLRTYDPHHIAHLKNDL